MKIETLEIAGFRPALRAMRNPMDSWKKSDTAFTVSVFRTWDKNMKLNGHSDLTTDALIGPEDRELSEKLQKAGTEHCKHLRMIQVWADITAPRYWWTEFDTYRAGVEKVSCSTMHKIHAKEFVPGDFAHEHIISHSWSEADNFDGITPSDSLQEVIAMLNSCREKFLKCKEIGDDGRAKMFWWQMIQLLPQSYLQKRTVMMSYAALRNIYRQRAGHKLDEWNNFRMWVESLPESWMITE